ncbi:MAG: FkbM family methyltransferase [Selenomonadaceae bacterium]|nr:FkbM family methyltransferase [Selenomonadaceae bacterium]
MFKVLLWDNTGESALWAKKFLKRDVEIIRTLRPDDPDKVEVLMRGDWNFVLIFENGQRELFDEIFKKLRAVNFSTENIVFANDIDSWLNHPAAVFALLKPQAHDQFYRYWNFFNHRRWHYYHTASAEGLHYLATAADNFVIRTAYIESKSHASDELKIFHDLVKKFYGGVDDSSGYFLELGANIGTAGIYFLKKIAPNMKWLAFEPDPENFKLLRVNTILNDLEDRATLVNCGLGDKFDELIMYRNLSNPGGNGIFNKWLPSERNAPTEKIKVIPLDSYLAENKIAVAEIKYIWIDTEGFEAQVLLGAKNFLTQNAPPIFMEFNPMPWNRSGYFDRLVELLKSVGYTHFIWMLDIIQRGQGKIYPIDKLFDWKSSDAWIGSLGDIFLIKNLA